jgi:hypothetical protein
MGCRERPQEEVLGKNVAAPWMERPLGELRRVRHRSPEGLQLGFRQVVVDSDNERPRGHGRASLKSGRR